MISNSKAAPLPPLKPVDVSGTVMDVRWLPEKSIEGIPGMSGSAGRNRTFPAHFMLELKNVEGVDHETAKRMTYYVAGPRAESGVQSTAVFLQLNHNDRNFLQKDMKIRVTGYTIRGDEGGTWTSYEKLDIISSGGSDPGTGGEEVIRSFFRQVHKHNVQAALALMDHSLLRSESAKRQWSQQFGSMRSVTAVEVQPYAKDEWSPSRQIYKVLLKIRFNPEAEHAAIPYYGWSPGRNIRWIETGKERGKWKISGINTGP